MKITKIKSKGPFIVLITSDGKRTILTRYQALERAQAISGLSPDAADIQRDIIKACREACRAETGRDYHQTTALSMIIAEEKDKEGAERRKSMERLKVIDAMLGKK